MHDFFAKCVKEKICYCVAFQHFIVSGKKVLSI